MPKEGICATPPLAATGTTSSRNPARRLATLSRISAEFAREFFCLTFMGLAAVDRVQKVVPSAFITIKIAACFCREEGNYGEGVLALLDCFARLERRKGGKGRRMQKLPSLSGEASVCHHCRRGQLLCSIPFLAAMCIAHILTALTRPLSVSLRGRPAARSSSNVDRARYNLAERYFVFFLLCSVFDPSFSSLPSFRPRGGARFPSLSLLLIFHPDNVFI